MNTYLMDLGDRSCTKVTHLHTRGGKENSSESGQSCLRGISPPKGVDGILFTRNDAVRITSDHKCFGTFICTIMMQATSKIW